MHAFESKLAESFAPSTWEDVTVLLAVSGGPDSMALLRGMSTLKQLKQQGRGRLAVAHVNHGLRGAESDADQVLVEEVCRTLALECHVTRLDPSTLDVGLQGSVEAALRRARYACLTETAGRIGARYLLTAHTADDQAETILHRIIRGSGLAGLAGIPARRRINDALLLVRPLLGVRRTQVVAYLAATGQAYREDLSNRDLRFTRNRIRHELLPLLARRYNPGVGDALLRLARLADQVRHVIAPQVERMVDECVRFDDRRVTVDCDRLDELLAHGAHDADARAYLVREMFAAVWRRQDWPQQSMGFDLWVQLADLALRSVGAAARALTLPGRMLARREGSRLELEQR